jgi:hypothetical protein
MLLFWNKLEKPENPQNFKNLIKITKTSLPPKAIIIWKNCPTKQRKKAKNAKE